MQNNSFFGPTWEKMTVLYLQKCVSDPQNNNFITTSCDEFFWWSVAVKWWRVHLPFAASNSSFIQGTLRFAEFGSMCQELELNNYWCFLLWTLPSHFHSSELLRCQKQAVFYVFLGHRVMHAELQILVCLAPSFVAIVLMITQKWLLRWLVVNLKRKGTLWVDWKRCFLLF